MTRPARKAWLANATCLALLAWLYGGDLRDALQARTAEVAAFEQLPSTLRPAAVLALTAAALAAALYGLARGRGADFRGYRLLPIVLVTALFLDLLFAEREVPVSSAASAGYALQHFAEAARGLATDSAVPPDAARLRPLVEALGRPPYLVRGAPVAAYGLQVRQDCDGPVTEAPGAQVGTLLYCVAPRGEGAWVTLVALPTERRFGAPQVLSAGGRPRVAVVLPAGGDAAPRENDGGSAAFRDGVAPADAGRPGPR
jgi:hypothetical protein